MYHGAEAAGDTQAYSTNICIQRIHIFPIKEAEVSKQTKFEPCGPTRIFPQQTNTVTSLSPSFSHTTKFDDTK
jgi:hypothetical protein